MLPFIKPVEIRCNEELYNPNRSSAVLALEIDEYYKNGKVENIDKYNYEIFRCANRDSVPQFYLEKPGVNEQYYSGREEVSNKDFLGIVIDYDD